MKRFSKSTKYMDLPQDIRTALDTLEKTIYQNSLKMEDLKENSLDLQQVEMQVQSLNDGLLQASNDISIDMAIVEEYFEAIKMEIKFTDAAMRMVEKINSNQSIPNVSFSEYFHVKVDDLQFKLELIKSKMEEIRAMLGRGDKSGGDDLIADVLRRQHQGLILLASRYVQLKQRLEIITKKNKKM